jgi:hypothetical protein
MTTSTLTVTEFMEARIAELRTAAERAKWAMQGQWFETAEDDVDELVRITSPELVLAQCAAMRKIVELAGAIQLDIEHLVPTSVGITVVAGDRLLRVLASIWSDHPQFDPAWA